MHQLRFFSLLLLICIAFNSMYASSLFSEGYAKNETENNTRVMRAAKIIKDDTASRAKNTGATKAAFVRGYRGFVETGFDIENGKDGDYNWLKVNFINSYQFYPGFMLGVGLGLRNNLKQSGKFLFPVFLALRAQFSAQKKIEPFFSLYGGYNVIPEFPLNEGGYFVNPQIGVDMNLGRKSSAYFGVGVELKKGSRNSWHYWYGPKEVHKDLFHFSFMVGFSF